MDYNDSIKNAYEMWDWREQDYCLQRHSSVDTARCLWDDVNQNEESLLYMFEEQTPIKDCMEFNYNFYNAGDNTNNVIEESKNLSHSKRRRVLQFTSDSNDNGFRNEQIGSCCLNTEVRDDPMLNDRSPGNLHWTSEWDVAACDNRSTFSSDVVEQSSEGWIPNCFRECELQCSQDEMNDSLASSEKLDISEFCNVPAEMETYLVQENPVQTPQKIFKGRKSLINTPVKLTTSIAYPFALIKPCEVQGDVTLKDINQKIHAPPPSNSKTKHGEASSSYPTSAFSGKPVVVKTKIRTEGGRGSITIMRTKG